MANTFASVIVGRERRPRGERLSRHRHAHGYAAVVLAGGYEEAGERARLRVRAGDVIKAVAKLAGGGGGGRPDFATGGGTQPDKLDAAWWSPVMPVWM